MAGLYGEMRFVASVGADKRVLLSLEAAAEVLRPVLTAVGSKAFTAADFQVHTASLCYKDCSAVGLCDAMHVHMLQGTIAKQIGLQCSPPPGMHKCS